MTTNELLEEVLKLCPEDRIGLLEQIVESLTSHIDPQEMEQRMKQVASGEGALIPGDEVLLRAQTFLEK